MKTRLSSRAVGALTAAMIVSIGGLLSRAECAPSVRGVRHTVGKGLTRVVVDVSARSDYKVFRVEKPERIAVNLPGVQLSGSLKPFRISSGAVYRVRFNRLSWGSQVVLDLREQSQFEHFFLAAMDGMPNRIVLDVAGTSHTPTAVAASVPASTTSGPSSASRKTNVTGSRREIVVAIDAGHGGSDPGAIGKGRVKEKTEALDMAKRLARRINAEPGYRAFLTRERDVFLTLTSRTRLAREKGADVFVSVHLNTAPRRSARGSEVYFLSPRGAQATANKFLSNKSRAAEELGLEGPSSTDILHMLVDVNQQAMLQRSSLLAEHILRSLNRRGLPPPRAIKQRSFAVLKSIDMPSVIVETGFLTNSQDRAILTSDDGKQQIADAVAQGVISFLKKYPPAENQNRRYVVHRVRKGDTLWRISRKYKTTVASIQYTNKLGRSNSIRIGQKLVIREGHETY